MPAKEFDNESLAESTAGTILPTYQESWRAPRYEPSRRALSFGTGTISLSTENDEKRKKRDISKRAKSMSSVSAPGLEPVPAVRRLPPEHLSRRPAQLPPPSCTSPFDSPAPRPQPGHSRPVSYDNRWRAAVDHADGEYHRIHGVRDARMHAKPELDEQGRPIRSQAASTMIAGAAVGVLAVAACNIM